MVSSQGRVFFFFFVSCQSPRAKSMREGEKKKNKHRKKKQHHIPWLPMCPVKQQKLDTLQPQNCCSLSTAHVTLWRLFTVTVWQWNNIHFASKCSRKSTMITDHWVHGDLQCRSTWSTICFFLHDSPKPMRANDEKQSKKKNDMAQWW